LLKGLKAQRRVDATSKASGISCIKKVKMGKKNTVKMTQEGYDALKSEFEELVNVKRPATVDRLANARSMGDLSENSDYHSAKEALEFLDGRISELEVVLANAQVMSGGGADGEVGMGAKVTVKTNGSTHTFHIVGEWEADPKEKKISHESPLGQALVGKRVGEQVEVQAPAGKVQYTIVSVE
jgi:transcription elongation factor GreA